MLSQRVLSLLQDILDEGEIIEDRVWELFESYVDLYLDGELDEFEKALDYHQPRFRRFLKHNSDPTLTPKRVTPAKTDTRSQTSIFPKRRQTTVTCAVQ